MTSKEKYIIETVAINARKELIDNEIIKQDALTFTKEDISQIVSFFGGELTPSEREDGACIKKISDNDFKIMYDETASNMDIMHELGHAFFDLKKMKVNVKLNCRGLQSEDLRAAFFARSFLLPRYIFEKIVIACSKNGKCDVQEVAKIFKIDYLSVLTRGEELNIWG